MFHLGLKMPLESLRLNKQRVVLCVPRLIYFESICEASPFQPKNVFYKGKSKGVVRYAL